MKTIYYAFVLMLVAAPSFARSPMGGPLVTMTYGNIVNDPTWVLCRILPDKVEITVSNKGVKTLTAERNNLNADQFENDIREASKAQMTRALHIRATVPAIAIQGSVRGAEKPVSEFVIWSDGGSMTSRRGDAARSLAKIARDNCPSSLFPKNEE